jgi:hypothetical protein
MGEELNVSFDTMPPEHMYEAARISGGYVQSPAPNLWDFTRLLTEPPPETYVENVRAFLGSVKQHGRWGWKLPETILSFPWITKLFPEASYIYWRRDPRDACRSHHITDKLCDWNVPVTATTIEEHRLLSWLYQEELVQTTLRAHGPPKRFIEVRFEDFVIRQNETLARLQQFLGFPLAKIPVDRTSVGRTEAFPFPREIAGRFGY